MASASSTTNTSLLAQLREFFTTRDFIFHDGRDLKRFSIAGRTQVALACIGAMMILFAGYGVVQAAFGAIVVSGVAGEDSSPEAQMAEMRKQVNRMQADVAAAKQAAKAHAARVEKRQAILSDLIEPGSADRAKINQPTPEVIGTTSAVAEEVLEPLRRLEKRQLQVAARAKAAGEARYRDTVKQFRRLGLAPERYTVAVSGGMGGPYEAVDSNDAAAAEVDADAQFRTLFLTWKKLDMLEQTVISIPSMHPVDNLSFTSTFGVRSDPFRGSAAMHAGVDIPGAIGTPIYATADGIVTKAGRQGGYGNLVQINHGKGIETRYGHLSKILVAENTRIRRGQIVGLMGSTGRSTGSHLHYEVRVDGRAVNPIPFLQSGEYLAEIQQRAKGAMGGPAK